MKISVERELLEGGGIDWMVNLDMEGEQPPSRDEMPALFHEIESMVSVARREWDDEVHELGADAKRKAQCNWQWFEDDPETDRAHSRYCTLPAGHPTSTEHVDQSVVGGPATKVRDLMQDLTDSVAAAKRRK